MTKCFGFAVRATQKCRYYENGNENCMGTSEVVINMIKCVIYCNPKT